MGAGHYKAISKMDVDKSKVNVASKKVEGKKILFFFRDVKQELKKVEWTTAEELKSYVKIFLISAFSFAMVVYGVDIVIQAVLGLIGKIFS